MDSVKILVCGYGSIGKKHAANLRVLGADIKIWRARSDRSNEIIADKFTFEPDLAAGIAWCDGTVIATDSASHLEPAMMAAAQGKAIYLEKPVSNTQDGVEDLLSACTGLVVEVGCQLRHHPNLIALKQILQNNEGGPILAFNAWVGQRLDQWRPGTDYRKTYSADAARGGGALFDLVHEIDLMAWFSGPMRDVFAMLSHNSDLEMKAEDLANLVLKANNGAAGVVQLDMLSPAYRRGLQIICAEEVFTWEMLDGIVWRAKGTEKTILHQVSEDYKPSQMLQDCMAYFLKRIADPSLPAHCSLEEGIHDLQILLAAKKSDKTRQLQPIE